MTIFVLLVLETQKNFSCPGRSAIWKGQVSLSCHWLCSLRGRFMHRAVGDGNGVPSYNFYGVYLYFNMLTQLCSSQQCLFIQSVAWYETFLVLVRLLAFFMDWNSVCCVPNLSSALREYFIWTNTQFYLQGAVNDRIENFISAHIYWELATFLLFCLKILFSVTSALSSLILARKLLFTAYQLQSKEKETAQVFAFITAHLKCSFAPLLLFLLLVLF